MNYEPEVEDVNGGDCNTCGGTGATYEQDDSGEWSVSGDCEDCDGSGDASRS